MLDPTKKRYPTSKGKGLKEQEERLEQINDAVQIEISDKILSLNLIKII